MSSFVYSQQMSRYFFDTHSDTPASYPQFKSLWTIKQINALKEHGPPIMGSIVDTLVKLTQPTTVYYDSPLSAACYARFAREFGEVFAVPPPAADLKLIVPHQDASTFVIQVQKALDSGLNPFVAVALHEALECRYLIATTSKADLALAKQVAEVRVAQEELRGWVLDTWGASLSQLLEKASVQMRRTTLTLDELMALMFLPPYASNDSLKKVLTGWLDPKAVGLSSAAGPAALSLSQISGGPSAAVGAGQGSEVLAALAASFSSASTGRSHKEFSKEMKDGSRAQEAMIDSQSSSLGTREAKTLIHFARATAPAFTTSTRGAKSFPDLQWPDILLTNGATSPMPQSIHGAVALYRPGPISALRGDVRAALQATLDTFCRGAALVTDMEDTQASRVVATFLKEKGYKVGDGPKEVAVSFEAATTLIRTLVTAVEDKEVAARSSVYGIPGEAIGANALVAKFFLERLLRVAGTTGHIQYTGAGINPTDCGNGNPRVHNITSSVPFSKVFAALLELAAGGVWMVDVSEPLTVSFNQTRGILRVSMADGTLPERVTKRRDDSSKRSTTFPSDSRSSSPKQETAHGAGGKRSARSPSQSSNDSGRSRRKSARKVRISTSDGETTGDSETESVVKANRQEVRSARKGAFHDQLDPWVYVPDGEPVALLGSTGHWARYIRAHPGTQLHHLDVLACPCCGSHACRGRRCANGGQHPTFLTIPEWTFNGQTVADARVSYQNACRVHRKEAK